MCLSSLVRDERKQEKWRNSRTNNNTGAKIVLTRETLVKRKETLVDEIKHHLTV